MEFLNTMNWAEIAGVAAAFVLFFDRLSKLTPTNSDDQIVASLYRIFTIFGVRVPDVQAKPVDKTDK